MANLALSISGLTLNGLPSGQPRVITITNTGSTAAIGLTVNYPTWPAGTVVTPTVSSCSDGGTLLAGASCTITVTPGATATSGAGNAACTTGIAPTPGVVAVGASNSNQTATNVVVLSYGCIYQGGYIFAMLETVNNAQSIGGTVVAQTDQAPRFPNGVVWSSNGVNAIDWSYDTIPGISEDSTPNVPTPTYITSRNRYNSRYSNENAFPFPAASSFNACAGISDGACNSANILTLYDYVNTNFGIGSQPYTLTAGPTNPNFYAAGLCTAIISGFSDWYLPAICEMGSASGICNSGTQNISDNFPAIVGDPNSNPDTSCALGINCLSGLYNSSTQITTTNANILYDAQEFNINVPNQPTDFKDALNGVRCTRALIP